MEKRRKERYKEFDPPKGYYRAIKDFNLQFGSWSVSFGHSETIKSDDKGIQRWNPLYSNWQKITPPISNARPFRLSDYGDNLDKRKTLQKFLGNTEVVSNDEFENEIVHKKETVLNSKSAMRVLDSLPNETKVKISFA